MIVLRQPFAITLYAYLMLRDRDRIADIKTRSRDVYRGVLTAMAMNDPKRLERERAEVRADMRSAPDPAAQRQSVTDRRAAGLALATLIERSGVLDDRRN